MPSPCPLSCSRLDYCNGLSFWYQNHTSFTYNVFKIGQREYFQLWTDDMNLHLWWKLSTGFQWNKELLFKLLVYVYKALNGLAPIYISNCLNLYVPKRNLRSLSDCLHLNYPITRNKAGDRTFTVCASKLWNNLPKTLRNSASVRKHLKHIFQINRRCRGAGKARFNVATPTNATVTCTAYVLPYNFQTKSIYNIISRGVQGCPSTDFRLK